MPANQQIFRTRRNYNQWVANQTLEDYALRFTAKKSRYWSANKVAMTALGATAFLALEAIGGAITLSYGFVNALCAILVVSAIIFITGLPISYYASKYGVDIDLLTRGAGFGYLGSTITSLIYASFTFIFFAIEAAILASALNALFSVPLYLGYIISALLVIPIVTHGITFISRFQIATQPIWLSLQIVAIGIIIFHESQSISQWQSFNGAYSSQLGSGETVKSSFSLALFGAACSILFALMAQIGEQVDYLRFLPPREKISAKKWWLSMLAAGPGWIIIGIIKLLLGSFLAYLAFNKGISVERSADPTYMYQMVFDYFTHSPTVSLVLAGLMVIVCQLKINVTNAYAGSLAWSNFFSRLTHSHPGRVVWLVFNVLIALLLMELGIYRALENILGVFAIVAVAWLGSIAADLSINKALGLAPKGIEFKRAHLYDINPVGVGSLLIASIIGMLTYLNFFGETAKALTHFVTLAVTFVTVPAIAWLTKGRYYLARQSDTIQLQQSEYQCCICENAYEPEDMSYCPAYQGNICSLCCSLDSRCLDSCKVESRFTVQISRFLTLFLPTSIVKAIHSQLAYFIGIILCISLLNGGLMALIYYQVPSNNPETLAIVANSLWILFFILLIISGVLAWLFLLAHESRIVAQEESNTQTARLTAEINAHTITDKALQEAMQRADAANQAKSRYLSGISHELRTPLQTILGYAQILGQDESIPAKRRETINIIQRSGDYLADLIEGLLDVSKIEAGKLEIRRDEMDLQLLIDQMELMFRPQAESKGITFIVKQPQSLPKYVAADEKRVRQILINLLSNAIKFTQQGEVEFSLSYKSQVAEFTVRDTGRGIEQDKLDTIFHPFERLNETETAIPGTGLGLTIVHLLSDIMGGDVNVISTPGEGSCFSVSLMLSRIDSPLISPIKKEPITGYEGETRSICVVDDQSSHRGLIRDLLDPLGFRVIEADSATTCLQLLEEEKPDLFLLDVSMPEVDGLQLAKILRERKIDEPVIMISAEVQEHHRLNAPDTYHDSYMVKPIKIQNLLDKIHRLLKLNWVYKESNTSENQNSPEQKWDIQDNQAIAELRNFAEIGYAKGFYEQLNHIESENMLSSERVQQLYQLAKQVRFDKIYELLKQASDP